MWGLSVVIYLLEFHLADFFFFFKNQLVKPSCSCLIQAFYLVFHFCHISAAIINSESFHIYPIGGDKIILEFTTRKRVSKGYQSSKAAGLCLAVEKFMQ